MKMAGQSFRLGILDYIGFKAPFHGGIIRLRLLKASW